MNNDTEKGINESLGITPQIISDKPLPENSSILGLRENSDKISTLAKSSQWEDLVALRFVESFDPSSDNQAYRDPESNSSLKPFLKEFLRLITQHYHQRYSFPGLQHFRGKDNLGYIDLQAEGLASFIWQIEGALKQNRNPEKIKEIVEYMAIERLMQKYGDDTFREKTEDGRRMTFAIPEDPEIKQALTAAKQEICQELTQIAKLWTAAYVEGVKSDDTSLEEERAEKRPDREATRYAVGSDLAKTFATIAGLPENDIKLSLITLAPADYATPRSKLLEENKKLKAALAVAEEERASVRKILGEDTAADSTTESTQLTEAMAKLKKKLANTEAALETANNQNKVLKDGAEKAAAALRDAVNLKVGIISRVSAKDIQDLAKEALAKLNAILQA